MVLVRILMGVLIALGAVVLAVPAVVLVDLISGGSGLGLCPDGLGTCETSMYAMAELVVIFAVILGIIGAGIAGCVRLLRRLEATR